MQEAVRMLGTSFFHEMTGQGKKQGKSKVYDAATLVVEDSSAVDDNQEHAYSVQQDEWAEEDLIEVLIAEGDDDAIFVADYEAAASEILQADDDLSTAYSSYLEARRKLSEKVKSRGFWPLGKGKGRFSKGRGKGKSVWSSRKTLQQRILESNCRLCGKKGHWRNECPNKPQGSSSNSATAAVTLSMAMPENDIDENMPEEFLVLPEVPTSSAKDILSGESTCVQSVFYVEEGKHQMKPPQSASLSVLREKIRNHMSGKYDKNFAVKTMVSRIEQKIHRQAVPSPPSCGTTMRILRPAARRILRTDAVRDPNEPETKMQSCPHVTATVDVPSPESPVATVAKPPEDVMFSTHDTWGIIDTGATKTVMGSQHVKEFLEGLSPEVKKQVKRCQCDVLFRFGNQGTLRAMHALVIPVGGLWLKIAVVKGATPFLISNTLLRALGATVNTMTNELQFPHGNLNIQMQLSSKGLYLVDMNELIAIPPMPKNAESTAETYAQETCSRGQKMCQKPQNVNQESRSESFELRKSHSDPMKVVQPALPATSHQAKAEKNRVPVIHEGNSAHPNLSQFCSQDIRAPNCPVKHEQLDSAPLQSPSKCGECQRTGAHRPSEPCRAEGHAHDFRKGPFGQDVRRDLGFRATVDQVVHGPLLDQQQDRSPQNDPLHPIEDRGIRDRSSTALCKEPSKGNGNSSEEPSCSGDPSGHPDPKSQFLLNLVDLKFR